MRNKTVIYKVVTYEGLLLTRSGCYERVDCSEYSKEENETFENRSLTENIAKHHLFTAVKMLGHVVMLFVTVSDISF